MSNVAFLWIFSRGIELGVIVLCLLPLRALLRKKVPRIFSYLLWATLPVSLVYNLVIRIISLFNHRVIVYIYKSPKVVVDERMVHALGGFLGIGTIVVITAMVVLYLGLLRYLVGSIRIQKGVYETDRINAPFTLGLLQPKIYLPTSLKEECRESVILHERVHIARKDVWMKYLAVGILGLFWFQPIMWFAYRLFIKDMEAACDESVLHKKGAGFRAEYARSLVEVSYRESKVYGAAIGYGNGDIKERIENVLNYKPVGAKLRVAALVICFLFALATIPISWQVPRLVRAEREKCIETDVNISGGGITRQDITKGNVD